MPKLKITAIHRETVTMDSGDMPKRLIETLLEENDGQFTSASTGYSLADVGRSEWVTESIEVEEVTPPKSRKKG